MTDGQGIRTGVHRAASSLRSALCDRKMLRFDAPRLIGVVPKAGRTIEGVESRGKHLEIRWDDGIILHTHFRMNGSWQLHRTGESWRSSHDQMRVRIEVPGWVAVCFSAATVETYRAPDALRHPGLGGVGPDISRPDADLARCVQLLLAYADRTAPLADVLLDQRVFFGLGNVYRSEVLWACSLSPKAPVGALTEADAIRIVNIAASLLRANLQRAEVVTMPGAVCGSLAVYGRRAQPCPRCAEPIRERATGPAGRPLYWCPGCQVRGLPHRGQAAAPDHSVAIASSTFIRDAFAAG